MAADYRTTEKKKIIWNTHITCNACIVTSRISVNRSESFANFIIVTLAFCIRNECVCVSLRLEQKQLIVDLLFVLFLGWNFLFQISGGHDKFIAIVMSQ